MRDPQIDRHLPVLQQFLLLELAAVDGTVDSTDKQRALTC
jgi:hypothetical protein